MPSQLTLTKTASASIPTPATNKASIYVESVTGEPYYKNDAGTAISLKGATGATGGITISVQSVTSSATVTPTFTNDIVDITAQAAALALANPTGTAQDGWGIVVRIKDNGTARAISYGSQYRAIGITLPASTVISKTTYLGMIYNAGATKWDVVSVGTES